MARLPVRDNFDLQQQRVTNLANPVDPQDGANRQWVLDQIPSDAGTGNYRGNWASSNSYSRGDVIYYDADTNFYIANAAIAADVTTVPSASTIWEQINGGGNGDAGPFTGRWQQNTAYETGDVIYTDGTTSLFGESVRNKIYRVENNFTSANLFDTANLAIIGERNTTYAIEAGTSTTANSAEITLVGSDITEDDVTLTGGDNVTITRNSDSQITIAADLDAPIRVWDVATAYTTGDQVIFDQGGNVNSIYIAIQDSTGESPHDTTSTETENRSQTFWRLVRSGIVSLQTNGGTNTGSGGVTANTTLHLNEGTGINIQREGTTFTFSATDMGVDIPSGTSLPTTGTSAGDFFFLQADEGTNLQGLYERNSDNTAWIPGNTERTDAEIDARVQAGVQDWAETDNTTRIPDDKMSLTALQRVQRVRLDGTTLRFYYGTDVSGNGDFTADVSDLTDFPFFHYADIDTRNAATDHNGRSIFATVSNDSGDGSADPQGTFAAYVLTNPPAAGQPTVNGNWDRITSPDSIINEVCVQVYNEATGMFEQRSLGTTSAVEGLTENTANGLYFRQDQRFSEIASNDDARMAARTNLDVPATTDLATVEFPGSDTETRLANIEFNDAGDQITFRNAGGMTQSFTGGGAPNGGYPSVGGIALEQLGSVTHGAGDTNSWPTGSAQVFGENADMITYTAGGGSGNQTVNGVLTNNTGSTIDLSNGVLDVDITITAITGVSLQAGFGLILPQGDATTPVTNSPYMVVLPIVNFNNLPARLTVRVPIQSTATSAWTNGGTIGLVVTENNSAERPFSYDVNSVRLSYTSHDFHKVGAAADIVFQETDGTITNLDSISVDVNNRLLFSGPTGALVYAGGGSGDVMSSDVITAWTSGTSYDTGRLVYTTTGNATLNWRRNATAYSADTATAEAERANSPDSTDGAALWDVLPPVINTAANSPIVVDRSGFNVGVVDHSLRRVDASGRRLDLAPPSDIVADTYNNPHITVDQYGRITHANNGTALTDLPHTGYSYSRQDNLSNNLYTNRSQDVYNQLGLHLAFNTNAVDVAQGTEIYVFSNGNADTGTHVLTLRRNAEPETDIFEGHTFVWDVIFGFDWLEQFLAPADLGSSTRDLDLTSMAALSAFSSLYTRDTITRPAVLERLGSGEVRWVYPQDVVDGDMVTANNTVTKGGINTAIAAVNSRIDDLPTANTVGDEWPRTGGFAFGGTGSANLAAGAQQYYWSTGAARYTSGANGWTYTTGTGNASNQGLTLAQQQAARSSTGGRMFNATGSAQTVRLTSIDINVTELPSDGSTSPIITLDEIQSDGTYVNNIGVAAITVNALGRQTINISNGADNSIASGNGIVIVFSETSGTESPFRFDVENIRVSSTADEFDRIITSPFDNFTITGTPTTTNAVPKWTAENTLAWSTDEGGGMGATTFLELTDTPGAGSYSGSAGDVVQVNSAQDGLIFNQLKELASDFNANQFYERGDVVTVLTAGTPNTYAIWILDHPSLNGRTTAIPAADQPGGSNDRWQQFAGGGTPLTADAVEALDLDFLTTNIPQIGSVDIATVESFREYDVVTNIPRDLSGITTTTDYIFHVTKNTPGDGGTVAASWFVINGLSVDTTARGGMITNLDGSGLTLRSGLNVFLVRFGQNAETISGSGTPAGTVDRIEFRVDGSSANTFRALYGISLEPTPTVTRLVLGGWTLREDSSGNLEFVRGAAADGTGGTVQAQLSTTGDLRGRTNIGTMSSL